MNLDLIYGYNFNYFKNRREPFRRIECLLNSEKISSIIEKDELDYLNIKIENSCSKLIMAIHAGQKAIDKEFNFILSQNKECPALFGEEEIDIVFYAESLILFSRAALDILATFLGKILLEPIMTVRVDSFNKFIKSIHKIDNKALNGFKNLFDKEDENQFSWLKVLCGSSKGRAVRDQIVHQKNLNVYYAEYRTDSAKEKCFVECLGYKLSLDYFINYMIDSLLNIVYRMEDFIIDDFKVLKKLKKAK
ncbi:hypothetical protein [Vallitalea guaymasensis]|uniref:Uncharacterized protein n=1 Tax=Vallitalea guaymasensis TaxID=1185412 RepID=A0A8J8M8K8_9FIRM|nr:hypothetical protein [Vallitalea guaymasensis]QUH28213.1 hypothetical protein HYG85_04500 [Vallitalea guaymasensis]